LGRGTFGRHDSCFLVTALIWIEGMFGLDPDGYTGFLEWAIVAALFVSAAVLSLVAAGDWSRSRRTSRFSAL
jgi:hypothetical protein